MKSAFIIKKQLEKVGNRLCLTDGEWTSVPFFAYVYPLWRKKTSAFEPEYTEIGLEIKEYYLYLGPHDHDITALSDSAQVEFDNNKFVFMRRDGVKSGNDIVYYTGILKRIKEGEYHEY